jgi:cell division septation protein DedD
MKKVWLYACLFALLCTTAFAGLPDNATAAKTSADFTDLKDLDAATKAKFDALISAGVFDGVSEGTFGLKDEMNRAQFAKVAALIYGLKVDSSLTTSSFSDVKSDGPGGYALPYIEAIKAAGITEGYGNGTFNPAGSVTKEQLATFLVKGLGQNKEAQALPGVKDESVSDWAKGYVQLALQLKLLDNGEDGKFGGKSNATRDLLVTGAYEAKEQFVKLNPTPTPSPSESPTPTPTATPEPTTQPTRRPATPTPTVTPTPSPTPTPEEAPHLPGTKYTSAVAGSQPDTAKIETLILPDGADHWLVVSSSGDLQPPAAGVEFVGGQPYEAGQNIDISQGKYQIMVVAVDSSNRAVAYAFTAYNPSQPAVDVAFLSNLYAGSDMEHLIITFQTELGSATTSITDIVDLIDSIVINPNSAGAVTLPISSADDSVYWQDMLGFPMADITIPTTRLTLGDTVRVTFKSGALVNGDDISIAQQYCEKLVDTYAP